MTQGIVINAREDLEDHWRWQYDILVYPKESQSYQGLGDGWVAPQTSIASYGGISMEDLETIRQIPGVEVAAPLSILGYFEYDSMNASYENAERGKIYEIKHEQKAFDGLREIRLENVTRYIEYIDPNKDQDFVNFLRSGLSESKIQSSELSRYFSWIFSKVNVPPTQTIRSPNQMILVAIDPEAEERLYGLSDAVVEGENLLQAEVIEEKSTKQPMIPIIALKDQGLQIEESVNVARVEVPKSVNPWDLEDAVPYLESLPKTPLALLTINPYTSEMRYKNVHISFDQNGMAEQPYMFSFTDQELIRYTPIQFKLREQEENKIPLLYAEGKEKEKNPYLGEQDTIYSYRDKMDENLRFRFAFNIIGYYDSSLIVPKYASSWQPGDPVDLYTPQHSMILADGAGNPVEPRPMIPLPMKDAYYTGAPDALTTMDAAEIFYGDQPPISSVRVVVSGVEERSEESQKKIEQVAKEIMEKTGHQVEIMLGSSAGKVLIQLGGAKAGEIGLVEEGWQQKGVNWKIEDQISAANRWLFFYLLVIIFILSYTVITHSLLKRSMEFSMLRAIGWPRVKMIQILLCEIGLLALIPILPLMVWMGIWNERFNWKDGLLLVLINLIIIMIGYYSGSRKALWHVPREGLAGEGSQSRTRRLFPIQGIWGYILHQLLRRPLRFGLMLLSLVLSTVMVLLFAATQQSLSDFLFLSFLGEIVDLHLKPYQMSFLILGILFTTAVVAMLIFMNLVERRKEFYIMRSIGWSIQKLQRYLLIESGLIGALGGVIGTIAGYGLLTYFSSLWLPAWIAVVSILLPFLLLILCTWVLVSFST